MKSSKTKNLFFGIAILAILIIAFGWYYLGARPVSIELKSDNIAYFNVDNPVVELSINNLKDARNGQVTVSYDNAILSLSDVNAADSVSYDTLGNSIIFDLTENFINSGENKVAEMTFENLKPGSATVGFDEAKTMINNKDGEMKLELKDSSFDIGVASRESEENTGEQNSKDPNEL